MAARIAALFIVTGLFVAAWSGDHPPAEANPIAPRPAKPVPYMDEPVRETALRRWKQGPRDPFADVAEASEAASSIASADDNSVSSPRPESGLQPLNELDRNKQKKSWWDRLAAQAAKLIAEEQNRATDPIAAEAGDAILK